MDEGEIGIAVGEVPHASPRRRELSDAFGAVERVVADQMSSLATPEFDDELYVMDAEVEVANGKLSLVERLNGARGVRFSLAVGANGNGEIDILGDVVDVTSAFIWVRTPTGECLISVSAILRAGPVPVTGTAVPSDSTTSMFRRFADESDAPMTFELAAGRPVSGRIVRVGADHVDVMVTRGVEQVWSLPFHGVRCARSANRSY